MPEVENRAVTSRERRRAVLWNPHGFYVAGMLPPRVSFNAS
jgi:hypothetical protein